MLNYALRKTNEVIFQNAAFWPRYDRFEVLVTLHNILKIRNQFLKKIKAVSGCTFRGSHYFLVFVGPLVALKQGLCNLQTERLISEYANWPRLQVKRTVPQAVFFPVNL